MIFKIRFITFTWTGLVKILFVNYVLSLKPKIHLLLLPSVKIILFLTCGNFYLTFEETVKSFLPFY